jgi:hypothetical protein
MLEGSVASVQRLPEQKGIINDGGPAGTAMLPSKSLREPRLQELAQLRRRPKLGNRVSSLKADVKAFDRLQMVRGRNSSYLGSKARS